MNSSFNNNEINTNTYINNNNNSNKIYILHK